MLYLVHEVCVKFKPGEIRKRMDLDVRLTSNAATVDKRDLDRSRSTRSCAATFVISDTKLLVPSTCMNAYGYHRSKFETNDSILDTYDRMNPQLTIGISIEHVNELQEHKFVTQVGILITITFKLHNFKT